MTGKVEMASYSLSADEVEETGRGGPAGVAAAGWHEPDVTMPPYAGVGRLLRTAHFAFMRLFTLNLAKQDMTFSQFQHLQYLWLSDGITQVELAARIGIRPAASTAVLLSLERGGHIRRVRNDVDRRKINVFLTPKGIEAKAALLRCAKEANEIASRTLSEQNVAELYQTVGVMVANLTAALPESSAETSGDEAFDYGAKPASAVVTAAVKNRT